MRFPAIILAAAAVTGCANTSTMYQWGKYDAMLYQSYKHPEKVLALQNGLESHIATLERSNLKVAPGLYAELGTVYLQSGDAARAVGMYTKERDTWPESKGLMDALIGNVGKSIKTKPAVKS
jgi:hypothetical protein